MSAIWRKWDGKSYVLVDYADDKSTATLKLNKLRRTNLARMTTYKNIYPRGHKYELWKGWTKRLPRERRI